MVDASSFSEYRSVLVSEPLRQGDVLERVLDDSTPWNRHLLVITADCDFAHDKHQGRVTCVPLLTKDEYLLDLHVPKLHDQTLAKLLRTLRNSLEKYGAPSVSDARLRAWPGEQTTEQIIHDLKIPPEGREATAGLIDAIRTMDEVPTSVGDAVSGLVKANRRLPNPKSEKNLNLEIISRLQNVFKQPPGDALFISSLAEGYDYGYFAYLRHLEQIWQPDISLGPSRLSTGYRRLSRLRETYTHALAQRFALVYMSIGLPSEYEELRDLHADLLEGMTP